MLTYLYLNLMKFDKQIINTVITGKRNERTHWCI